MSDIQLKVKKVLKKYKEYNLPDFINTQFIDIDDRGIFGDQAIHLACFYGDIEDVETLLGAGADVNSLGELGQTPLHYAIQKAHVKIVRKLLEKRADLTIISEFGAPYECAKRWYDHEKTPERAEILEIIKQAQAKQR